MLGANNVNGGRSSENQSTDRSNRSDKMSLDKLAKDSLKRGKGGGGKGGQNQSQNITKSGAIAVNVAVQSVEPKDLLENFAEKLAESKVYRDHMQFQSQIDSSFSHEIDQLFGSENKEKTSDSVVLSTSATVHNQSEIKKSTNSTSSVDVHERFAGDETVIENTERRLARNATANQSANTAPESLFKSQSSDQGGRLNETMRQFISAYSEDLILQTPTKKKSVSELRERLQTFGLSNKKISDMQSRVSAFVQKDFRDRVKKGFIQFALAYGPKMTSELMACSKQYKALEEMGLASGVLADEADAKEVKETAKNEMTSFIADELDNKLIQAKASGASFRELVAEFNRFNELASVIKFDAGNYMKTLGKKMENLGLNYFSPPEPSKGSMDTDSRKRQSASPIELELDPGILTDQYRKLIIQRSVRTDIVGAIESRFRIARLRGKLKKAGLTDVELSDIEKEGEALARVKLSDLIRESLEERAALPDLSGPAFDLVRAKLKKALKGLRKLGFPLPKTEFNEMKDQINKGMFSIIKEEFLKINAVSENMPSNKTLALRRKQLVTILERLRNESSILEDITSESDMKRADRSDGSVVEAA